MKPRTDWEVLVHETITELSAGATTVALYGSGHPRATVAILELEKHLAELHAGEAELAMVLLGEELFVQGRPITRRSQQAPSLIRRFRRRGVEHVTFRKGVAGDELREFLVELAGGEEAVVRSRPHIQVGRVELSEADLGGPDDRSAGRGKGKLPTVRDRVTLVLETFSAYVGGNVLAVGSLETVARSTLDALEAEADALRLFAPWEGAGRWQAVHAHNVCLLAQAMARVAGLARPLNVELGLAGLVHDVGKLTLPPEVLQRELDSFSENELELILDHPAETMSALLAGGQLPLVALIVAVEHHMNYNGTGYPRLPRPRRPHAASRIVALADAYVVLHTARGARGVMTRESSLAWIMRRSGTAFDPFWCGVLRRIVERA